MKQLKIIILAFVGCIVLTACPTDREDDNEYIDSSVNNDPPVDNEYTDTYNIPAKGCNATYTLSRLNSEITNVNLAPGMEQLVSLEGKKIWKWDTSAPDGVVWGNMGYCGGAFDWTIETAGKWWGVTSEEDFLGQLSHSNTGIATGEESMDAYMVFKEDGSLLKYNANGKLLNTGSFDIIDYNPDEEWQKAILETSAGAILWPFSINSSGYRPTKFEIVHLSVDQMVLVYPKGHQLGSWGEASFWRFRAPSYKGDWLSVSTSAYTYGNPKVEITAKANHTNIEREYVINITTKNNEKFTLKFVQAPGEGIPSNIDDIHNEVSTNPAYSKERQ